jgi:hypothetical protein
LTFTSVEESDVSVAEDMTLLAADIQSKGPGIRTETQEFPSGAVWLDVHFAGRLFIIAFLPSENGFGVDEADIEEHGIGTHFRSWFDDFESAKTKLLALLEEASAVPAQGSAGQRSTVSG